MKEIEEKLLKVNDLIKSIAFLHFKRSFPRFKKLGIHPGQLIVINLIDEKNGIMQKKLVEKTKREKATITKALQRLEKSGFIKRVTPEDDKRASLIYLTDKGRKLKKEFKELQDEDIQKLGSILNEEELDNIILILNKIKMELNEGEL